MINTINAEELKIKMGHNLTILRAIKDEKQDVAAKGIEIDRGTLSKIETGVYDALTIDLLIKICNYYGRSLEEVLGLGLTTNYNNSQPITVNSGGSANPTLKNIQHEVGGGYEKALEAKDKEIEFLRGLVADKIAKK